MTKVDGVTLNETGLGVWALRGRVMASYAELCALLGEPNSPGDGGKVSTEWLLEFEGAGFAIYDYKATRLYLTDGPTVDEFRARLSYNWHIGGPLEATDIRRFKTQLETALAALRLH